MAIQKFETELAGKKLSVEMGRLAGQTNSSCTVQYGDTVVLATAVMSDNLREDIDFFPLMVDYEEKLYAAGKIKSSRFIKREGRSSDEAILTGRLIDRSIRPLFNDEIRNEVQVTTSVLSFDQENDPDIVALIGASIVLATSNIPWAGPIGALRIGQINGEWVLNPSYEARTKSALDLVVSGTADKVVMLEAGAEQVSEDVVYEAIKFSGKHLGKIVDFINEIVATIKPVKVTVKKEEDPEVAKEKEHVREMVKNFVEENIKNCVFDSKKETKSSRHDALAKLRSMAEEHLQKEQIGKEKREKAMNSFDEFVEAEIARAILEDGKRLDCRALTEIRPLKVDVGLLPRTHGTGLFSRGETQVLSVLTLGAPSDEQTMDGMEVVGKKRYLHHYNFPSFSVGETGPNRGPGRREIGHGALAERALMAVLPPKEDFPYTIRVVSEVLSSNGSSSMASTCGSTLALMDGGVPIKEPVAGVAMGLVSDDKGNFKVITDLQDLEDSKGGMDFKIAGTKNGITAIQMDTKTHGLTLPMVLQTLKQAKDARMEILETMAKVLPAPRPELSQYAPRIISLRINPEKIGTVIGPGGKVINAIIDATGVDIDIEDDGLVLITSANAEAAAKALEWVKNLTREVKLGEIFQAKIVRLMDFGAFAELLPNQDGLIHISEMAPYRVNKVEDIVKLGDIVPVKVIKIDDSGKISLSMKRVTEK